MAMTFDDIMQPGYPHGTPEGFTGGCKSAAACPAKHTHGLDCRSAFTASKSDYTVAKLFKRGFAPAQIAAYLEDGIHPETPALAAVDTIPAPEPAPTPAPAPQPAPTSAKETTMSSTAAATPKPKSPRGPRPKFGSPTSTRATPREKTSTAHIREWAREKGYDIASMGKIPKLIRQHYEDDHAAPAASVDQEAEAPSTTIAERSDLLDETRARIADAGEELPAAVLAVVPDADDVPTVDTIPLRAMSDLWTALDAGSLDDFFAFHVVHGYAGTWSELLGTVRELWRQAPASAARPERSERPEWGDVAAARDVERARATAARFEAEWTRETERANTAERALALTLEKWDQSEEDCGRLVVDASSSRIRLMLAQQQIRHLTNYARRLEARTTTPDVDEPSESALVDHVKPRRGADIDVEIVDEVSAFAKSAGVDLLPWQHDVVSAALASNPTITPGPARHVQRRRPWWIRLAAFFGFAD